MKKINNIIFILFVTFCTFNLYKIQIIHDIGKYGKIIILLYIILFLLWKKSKFIINKYIGLILLLSISFIVGSFNYFFIFGLEGKYFYYALIFSSYMLYLYAFVYTINYYYPKKTDTKIYDLLKKTIYFNFIIGFLIAFLFGSEFFVLKKGNYYFGGFFDNGLFFAWYSLVAFFVSLFTVGKSKIDKIVLFILLIFIFTSGGRGAQLTLLVFGVYLVMEKIQSYVHNRYFINILNLLFLILIILLISFVSDLIDSSQVNSITTGRWFIWMLAAQEIVKNNIYYLGWGLGSTADYILDKYYDMSYYFQHLYDTKATLYLHSSYLALIAAGGLMAIISFLSLNYFLYKKANKIQKAFIVSLMAGGAVEQFYLSPNIPISMLFWLISFIIILQQEKKGVSL